MPSDPVSAGRKGGAACTPAQNAARRKNGFQPKAKPIDEALLPGCGCVVPPAQPPAPAARPVILVARPKEGA